MALIVLLTVISAGTALLVSIFMSKDAHVLTSVLVAEDAEQMQRLDPRPPQSAASHRRLLTSSRTS